MKFRDLEIGGKFTFMLGGHPERLRLLMKIPNVYLVKGEQEIEFNHVSISDGSLGYLESINFTEVVRIE